MQITIDGHEFDIERRRIESVMRQIGGTISQVVRAESMQAKREVQVAMPVDTGRAKASWGNKPSLTPAQLGDGIWDVKDDGFTIIQGSNVEYVPDLNDGHSAQAPAGFIDAVAVRAKKRFENTLSKALLELLMR